MQVVDRRLNPKGKSLGNRQRFLRRARTQIREAVQKSLKDARVADVEEPKDHDFRQGPERTAFPLDRAHRATRLRPAGQRGVQVGDEIDKPKSAAGAAARAPTTATAKTISPSP